MFASGFMKLTKVDGEIREKWEFFFGPKHSLHSAIDHPPPEDKERRDAFIVQMFTHQTDFSSGTKFRKIARWEDAKCHWSLLQEPLLEDNSIQPTERKGD